MTKFNISLLLSCALPVCILAVLRGYDAGNTYVFLVGALGTLVSLFFGVLFVRARRDMKRK